MTKKEQIEEQKVTEVQEEVVEAVDCHETEVSCNDNLDEEMTKSEARDYVEEQIDEDFMEDVSEPKMTPEKAAQKIKEFGEEIETLKERIEVISPVAELPNLDTLKDLVKEQTIKAVENMDSYDMKESSKEAKDGIKGLESIAFTENLLKIVRSELSAKKARIDFCEKEIDRLKAQGFQCNLFDKANPQADASGVSLSAVAEQTEENSEVEENIEVKKENQEETGE